MESCTDSSTVDLSDLTSDSSSSSTELSETEPDAVQEELFDLPCKLRRTNAAACVQIQEPFQAELRQPRS